MTLKKIELLRLIARTNRELYSVLQDWDALKLDTPPSGYTKKYIDSLEAVLARANAELAE